jgi:hypothetical protein
MKNVNALLLFLLFILFIEFASCTPPVHIHKTMEQPDCLNMAQDTTAYVAHSDPSRSFDTINQHISKSYPLLKQFFKKRLYFFAYKDSAIFCFRIASSGHFCPYVYGNSMRISAIEYDTLFSLLQASKLDSIPNDSFTTHIKLPIPTQSDR